MGKKREEKKTNTVKLILNVSIMFIAVCLILYFSLKDNFKEIIGEISKLNIFFLLLALLFCLMHRVFLGISMYKVIINNNHEFTLKKAIKLSFITQFFNGITPFATGGQPSQIYYLKKEGIPVASSTNIILQNFITYQTALIVLGIFALSYNAIFRLFPQNDILKNLIIIGFIINLSICIVLFLISFGKKFNKFIINKGIGFLGKIGVIKNVTQKREAANAYVSRFYENAMQISKQKKEFLKLIGYNLIALTFYYAVPVIIIYGMGDFTSINFIEAIVASAYVMIMGSFVPTPGGTGGLEYGFINFFGYFLDKAPLMATMLLWRGLSYYLGMLIGGLTIVFYKRGGEK